MSWTHNYKRRVPDRLFNRRQRKAWYSGKISKAFHYEKNHLARFKRRHGG